MSDLDYRLGQIRRVRTMTDEEFLDALREMAGDPRYEPMLLGLIVRCRYENHPEAAPKRPEVASVAPGEPTLLTRCWCDTTNVTVPKRFVSGGRTISCGRDGCAPIGATL